jgi:alpha-L-fucosidase
LNGKSIKPAHEGALVLDLERGRANGILSAPWQTDTCIGDWHYNRALLEQHRYKTAKTVVAMLVDIVSKNGNLLLSIPVRGNGTIDEDERKVLADLAGWMAENGEAIFETRPFAVYGEGPPDVVKTGGFNEDSSRPYTAQDIRFTTKKDVLYAFAMAWPEDGNLKIKTLTRDAQVWPYKVARIEMTGQDAPLEFTQGDAALVVKLPAARRTDLPCALKILRA